MSAYKWLAGLLAAIFLFCMAGCGKPDTPTEPAPTDGGERYTVTFYSDSGTVLKIDEAAENTAAQPPAEPQMTYGMIFREWDTDFTAVTEDLEVRPVCEEVGGRPNVFAVSGAYGSQGSTVMVPVVLCGDVCTAGFDATITYDSRMLELTSLTEDGAVVCNDETPGQLRLNYVSIENTTSDVDVVRLMFRVKAESGTVPVQVTVNEIYACDDTVDSENDSLSARESCVINGQVFVIP